MLLNSLSSPRSLFMTENVKPLTRQTFEGMYGAPKVPWDIGRPQKAFIEAGDQIRGRVLDIGCGTGELALWLAQQGCTVTGVDFLPEPLEAARKKATVRSLSVNFVAMDATKVHELGDRFDAVTDCGLFHVFDAAGRAAYTSSLRNLLAPGAKVFLLCFSDAEPGTQGPRRISESDLRAVFADGWQIENIAPARFESVPGIPGAEFTTDGAHSWFVVIRRI
jgi:2-polyprenyl-3-methyl-5-hydroxy-6-metoxy-1,4-benzoquinol methylase